MAAVYTKEKAHSLKHEIEKDTICATLYNYFNGIFIENKIYFVLHTCILYNVQKIISPILSKLICIRNTYTTQNFSNLDCKTYTYSYDIGLKKKLRPIV